MYAMEWQKHYMNNVFIRESFSQLFILLFFFRHLVLAQISSESKIRRNQIVSRDRARLGRMKGNGLLCS